MVNMPQFSAHDYVFQTGHALMGIGSGESQSRNAGFFAGFLYYLAQYDGHPYENKWAALVDGATLWTKIIDEGKFNASLDTSTKFSFGNVRINIRGYGNGSADAPGGQAACQDLLVAHPDIDILTFDCDPAFPGGEVIMAQNGLVPGENVWIACMADGANYGLEKIISGGIIAIAHNSSDQNAYGMASCMRDIFLTRRDMDNIIPNTYTPTVAITLENVYDYYVPGRLIAKGIPFELEDIDDYNARMKIAVEIGDPFYAPGYYISSEEWRKK
jgi:ribose transport system substrate-binding protein